MSVRNYPGMDGFAGGGGGGRFEKLDLFLANQSQVPKPAIMASIKRAKGQLSLNQPMNPPDVSD